MMNYFTYYSLIEFIAATHKSACPSLTTMPAVLQLFKYNQGSSSTATAVRIIVASPKFEFPKTSLLVVS